MKGRKRQREVAIDKCGEIMEKRSNSSRKSTLLEDRQSVKCPYAVHHVVPYFFSPWKMPTILGES